MKIRHWLPAPQSGETRQPARPPHSFSRIEVAKEAVRTTEHAAASDRMWPMAIAMGNGADEAASPAGATEMAHTRFAPSDARSLSLASASSKISRESCSYPTTLAVGHNLSALWA